MSTAVATQRRPYRFPPAVPSRLRSLAQLPADLLREHPRPDLLQQCTAAGLRPCATDAFVERVRAIGLALADMGLEPGDRVAIMSETRQEWVVADMGIVTARLVTVPIYPTLSGQQARFILQDSGARGVFVSDVDAGREDPGRPAPVAGARIHRRVHRRDAAGGGARQPHRAAPRGPDRARARPCRAMPPAVARYEAGIDAVAPDDLLTIIYTSGTTGEPKGVMLTHDNVLSNIAAVIPVLELNTGDVALSYLPLSHVFERMVTYLYLYEGLTVCHAESMDTLARDLQLVRPTVMTGVPRVYEKLHAKIHETVAAGPAFRRRLFEWAVRIGTEASAARREGRALSPFLKMQEAVADGLVASKIREKVGGRLRLAVSGSAALPAHIARFFHAVGVPLIEGYGLTETSPVITVNPRDRPRFGSVGCVIDGVDGGDCRGWRDPHARPTRDEGLLESSGRHRRRAGRRTAGSTPATSARSSDDGLPHDHGSEEGTAGHVGRQEDRARRRSRRSSSGTRSWPRR